MEQRHTDSPAAREQRIIQRTFYLERTASFALLSVAVALGPLPGVGPMRPPLGLLCTVLLPAMALLLPRLCLPVLLRRFGNSADAEGLRTLRTQCALDAVEAMLAVAAAVAFVGCPPLAALLGAGLLLVIRPRRASLKRLGQLDLATMPPLKDLLRRTTFPSQNLRLWNGASETPAMLVPAREGPLIVLAHSTLQAYSKAQLRVVIAHELGHFVHRDLARFTLVRWVLRVIQSGLAAATMFFAARENSPAAWALAPAWGAVAFWTAETLCRPVLMGVSRRQEAQANDWALRATDDAKEFVSTYQQLYRQLGSPPAPGRWEIFWFAPHPSLQSILRQGRAYETTGVRAGMCESIEDGSSR